MNQAELIYAAFKGLAAGLISVAADAPAPTARRRVRKRRPASLSSPKEQLPLSPELGSTLQAQFQAVDPREPINHPAPSIEELNELFAGNEAVEAFARQMKMQEQAGKVNPPQPPQEQPATAWGMPDK